MVEKSDYVGLEPISLQAKAAIESHFQELHLKGIRAGWMRNYVQYQG